jgi:plasmid stabilization system protein ParE
MYTVVFSKNADKDIINIVKHVAAENPQAAKKLGSNLLDLALSLDSMPYRGSKVKKRRGVLNFSKQNRDRAGACGRYHTERSTNTSNDRMATKSIGRSSVQALPA